MIPLCLLVFGDLVSPNTYSKQGVCTQTLFQFKRIFYLSNSSTFSFYYIRKFLGILEQQQFFWHPVFAVFASFILQHMNYSSQTFNRTIYTLESTVLMHLCIVLVFIYILSIFYSPTQLYLNQPAIFDRNWEDPPSLEQHWQYGQDPNWK